MIHESDMYTVEEAETQSMWKKHVRILFLCLGLLVVFLPIFVIAIDGSYNDYSSESTSTTSPSPNSIKEDLYIYQPPSNLNEICTDESQNKTEFCVYLCTFPNCCDLPPQNTLVEEGVKSNQTSSKHHYLHLYHPKMSCAQEHLYSCTHYQQYCVDHILNPNITSITTHSEVVTATKNNTLPVLLKTNTTNECSHYITNYKTYQECQSICHVAECCMEPIFHNSSCFFGNEQTCLDYYHACKGLFMTPKSYNHSLELIQTTNISTLINKVCHSDEEDLLDFVKCHQLCLQASCCFTFEASSGLNQQSSSQTCANLDCMLFEACEVMFTKHHPQHLEHTFYNDLEETCAVTNLKDLQSRDVCRELCHERKCCYLNIEHNDYCFEDRIQWCLEYKPCLVLNNFLDDENIVLVNTTSPTETNHTLLPTFQPS